MMVWIDSGINEYRRLIMPLAEEHSLLRLAILAISAAHMRNELGLEATFSHVAGETAIVMITERVRSLTDICGGDQHTRLEWNEEETEGILAAMLILSNHSLLGSKFSHARSHTQAARILINTLTLNGALDDEVILFLKNQLAIHDILACTTLFNFEETQDAVVPDPKEEGILFGHFLNIVHRITTWSFRELPDEPQSDYDMIIHLEEEFVLARGSTLLAARPLTKTCTRVFREDFIRVVQAYHHAGILYACKRLRLSDVNHVEKDHSVRLFKVLRQFEDVSASLHNLAWPIFIAGLFSFDDQERMKTVTHFCQMLLSNTRFEHYANLLTFLTELWQSSHRDWSLLARQWGRRGVSIIAV